MRETFKYLTFIFLLLNLRLIAEENASLNAIYLVQKLEFGKTTTKTQFLHEGPITALFLCGEKNTLRIGYQDDDDVFLCYFSAPEGQILQTGIYKNAINSRDSDQPYIDLPYIEIETYEDQSLMREFEIFEIEYDKKGNILSFAADFTIFNIGMGSFCKGAIRFNSSFLVDEYYVQMTNRVIDLKAENLFYVKKFNGLSGEEKNFIVKEQVEIYAGLIEDHGFSLWIVDSSSYSKRNEFLMHVPKLSDLSKLMSEKSDFDFFAQEPRVPFNVSIKANGKRIVAKEGFVLISKLSFDIKQDQILNLVLYFSFKDEEGNGYEGTIRYNCKPENFSESSEYSEISESYYSIYENSLDSAFD